ncbi:speckle-type POZ protein A, partial [Trichonephila inaurata madagascariensis]
LYLLKIWADVSLTFCVIFHEKYAQFQTI